MKILKHSMTILAAALTVVATLCYTSHRSVRRDRIAEVRVCDKVLNFGRSNGDCAMRNSDPHWSVRFHGGSEMVCKHQIALCKIHNCTACDHHGDEEHCPFAYHEGMEESNPTFAEAFEIFSSSKCGRRHRDAVLRSVEADIAKVGLSAKSKCGEMTRTKFKTLIGILQAPMADGRILHGETIKSHIAAFRSITSEWLEDKYNERGFELPQFSIPKFKTERPKVQEVSDRTIRKVEIEMEKWLASGKQSDRDAYAFCFFALYCGMRAGDICAAKWDILKHTTSGVMVVYTPHKTLHSTGVTVSFPIDNKTYCKIEPLIGGKDEYVIARHDNRAPAHVRKNGEFSGFHGYLRNKVNKMLSRCGIGNEYRGQKKAHALRKYFETDRAFQVGRQQAANECGHTLAVQKRSYLGTMIGKVS